VADHKKDHKGDDEEEGKAEEMSCILGETHCVILLPSELGPAVAAVAGGDGATASRVRCCSPHRQFIPTGRERRLYVSYVTDCRAEAGGMEDEKKDSQLRGVVTIITPIHRTLFLDCMYIVSDDGHIHRTVLHSIVSLL
jgi:hypothetical protein